jgi:SAM-dependent methyltransferase
MPPPSESPDATIAYYEANAAGYVAATLGVDMGTLYVPFVARLPAGGRVLDAGCGSGRDARAFLALGYEVVAFDAAPAMARAASALTGLEVAVQRFQDLEYDGEFDGVWACASLLHVPAAGLADAIGRLARALRPAGVLYASFKLGEGERREAGRRFTDVTPGSIQALVTTIPGVGVECIWETADVRPGNGDRWVNVLLRKSGDLASGPPSGSTSSTPGGRGLGALA